METLSIPFSSIIEGRRARLEYGDLEGLKSSIQKIGLIHPIVLSKSVVLNDTIATDVFILIAGGRRYRAMKELGVTELHHGTVLDPSRLAFLFKDEVPEDELREAELDENLYRLKPRWQEDVLLVAEVHDLKRKAHGSNKWGQAQTGALLGDGISAGYVSHTLKVAKALRAKDEQVMNSSCMAEALQILLKRQQDKALAVQNKRRVAELKTKGGDTHAGERTISTADSLAHPTSEPFGVPHHEIPLSIRFLNADCMEVEWPEVDHIVTDIPYGIDMDNLNHKFVADVEEQHNVDQNIDMMAAFLAAAFRSIRPGGFCVFFYDLNHHEKLQQWARAVGFKVQSWPYIAAKPGPAKNSCAQYNTNKNYEVCMWLRKDSSSVLRHPVMSSWGEYDFAADRKMYNNPFAKPYALWKFIYDAIAFPGQTVLDPYCGEMSASVAAVRCGLVPHGIELKEQHYVRGLEHVRKEYTTLHSGNVVFV